MAALSTSYLTIGCIVLLAIACVVLYYCTSGKSSPTSEEFVNAGGYGGNDARDDRELEHFMSAPASVGGRGDPTDVVAPAEDTEDAATSNESAQMLGSDDGSSNASLPKDCFPKDQLTPQELLPADANSTWAQVTPAGQGSVGDQNFLNAGFHVGINTVGQTLRNANLQLRSEPPNPQVKVSPWLQSTIEPDSNRKAMEIGGC